jgi:hypothetical protein
MASIARLLETFHPISRSAEVPQRARSIRFVQPHRAVQTDDADRVHAFETLRIRTNPVSLISPRF